MSLWTAFPYVASRSPGGLLLCANLLLSEANRTTRDMDRLVHSGIKEKQFLTLGSRGYLGPKALHIASGGAAPGLSRAQLSQLQNCTGELNYRFWGVIVMCPRTRIVSVGCFPQRITQPNRTRTCLYATF